MRMRKHDQNRDLANVLVSIPNSVNRSCDWGEKALTVSNSSCGPEPQAAMTLWASNSATAVLFSDGRNQRGRGM